MTLNRNPAAIAELGYRGDPSVIPAIKEILSQEVPRLRISSATPKQDFVRQITERERFFRRSLVANTARSALARLGDEDAFNDLARGLHASEPHLVLGVIINLGNTTSPKAAKFLISFLVDDGEPELRAEPRRATMPFASAAEESLANIFPDVAKRLFSNRGTPEAQRFRLWWDWWEENNTVLGGQPVPKPSYPWDSNGQNAR